jgi:RNA polymerase sigma-70 factor (ECF subfamily)
VYKKLDEQALARACSQRDRLAEEELYRRYAARVYALCRRYLGDEEEAKDLMLETLVQALDRIGAYQYQGKGSLYGWISRIAINKAINQIKRRRWRTVSLDFRAQDDIPDPTGNEMEAIPTEKLREWITELPDMRRAVFNLYCIDGYSHKEIGRMLGISETGSTSILAKARRQLKERIRQYLKEQA